MTPYELRDRRPIGEVYRKMAYGFVDTLVARRVHPDTISYFSMIFATAGGVLLYFSSQVDWLLIVAPVFFLLRLYCNMIDGMVAVKAGICSRKGEVINEMPDRYSDAVIPLGLCLSGQVNIYLMFAVMWSMLAGAYVGVLSKAVGARRQYGGVMAKQWRMFVLAGACWIQFAWTRLSAPALPLPILDLTALVILLGLVQTIIVRTRSMLKELAEEPASS